jgi:hypothetical protein
MQLLVKWWSDYPAPLLEQRVVAPMQSYLTKELMATKKLTIGVMNAIKVCVLRATMLKCSKHKRIKPIYNCNEFELGVYVSTQEVGWGTGFVGWWAWVKGGLGCGYRYRGRKQCGCLGSKPKPTQNIHNSTLTTHS